MWSIYLLAALVRAAQGVAASGLPLLLLLLLLACQGAAAAAMLLPLLQPTHVLGHSRGVHRRNYPLLLLHSQQ
jgi:hypothetical protein